MQSSSDPINSYRTLRDMLDLNDDIPYTPDWSAAADFLQIITDYCLKHKPATILECSSGLSTLILARCCQINKYGKVYSLENGKEYADKTAAYINHYQLQNYATVIHAPLTEIILQGHPYQWYETSNIPESRIDMLVIDGPSGFIQKNSRYPALPLLYNKLSKQSIVYLDDAAREDEQAIAQLWKKEFEFITHQYIETERGCSIFAINKS
ncbi:MAG: class I SAM-dependent methyltransferase [Gammaproteobacteria bacterium]|nr:class I SAM-dependent methyltransferase [Gammaproteobacteria bacterium]